MLALFGAKDREALEARLVQGDGPSARRLRRLAATFAFEEAPRLEQMRLLVDRRLASINLHCARMVGPGGRTGFCSRLRLWAPGAMSRLRRQKTAKLRR